MLHIKLTTLYMCLLWIQISSVTARPRSNGAPQNGSPQSVALGEILGGNTKSTQESSSSAPAGEPSCEQLRAMWRFSKRQSRAAEITNEIPSYRDPFTNNIWQAPYESYARSRSMGGLRVGYRNAYRPVYGRIVHKAPKARLISRPERNRAFEEVIRLYGNSPHSGYTMIGRRPTQFRLPGGYVGRHMNTPPHSGSFQHLKELIRTERARELQQQRMAEEMAARAAVLKASSAGNPDETRRHYAKYTYEGVQDDDTSADEASMRDYMMVGLQSGSNGDSNNAPILTFPDPVAPPASLIRSSNARLYDKLDDEEPYFESDFSVSTKY